jgi:uncharacterized protein (TIGR02266 family)
MSDPKRAARFAISFEVAYDDGEGFMTGKVVDVSESGLFIETVMPLKPGSRISITPLLPEKAGLFEVEGEVMRGREYDPDTLQEQPPGFGVRFVDITDEERENLKKLIQDAEADEVPEED